MIGSEAAVIAIVPSLPEIPISCDNDHAKLYGFLVLINNPKQES
ncbi:hypothetical protein [Actinomadura sp. GTD37]